MFDEIIADCSLVWTGMGVEMEDIKKALRIAIETRDDEMFDDGFCPSREDAYEDAFGFCFTRINGNYINWVSVGTQVLDAILVRIHKELKS